MTLICAPCGILARYSKPVGSTTMPCSPRASGRAQANGSAAPQGHGVCAGSLARPRPVGRGPLDA
eukprot:9289648-Prorocentrum_lima.AAC.1